MIAASIYLAALIAAASGKMTPQQGGAINAHFTFVICHLSFVKQPTSALANDE